MDKYGYKAIAKSHWGKNVQRQGDYSHWHTASGKKHLDETFGRQYECSRFVVELRRAGDERDAGQKRYVADRSLLLQEFTLQIIPTIIESTGDRLLWNIKKWNGKYEIVLPVSIIAILLL